MLKTYLLFTNYHYLFYRYLLLLCFIALSFTLLGIEEFRYGDFNYALQSEDDDKIMLTSVVDNADLTHLTIPATVPYNGSSYTVAWFAFEAFKDLDIVSIDIQAPLTYFPSAVFSGCRKLEHVILPNTLQYVTGFNNCTSLQTIDLPNSIRLIGPNTFRGCTSLKEVHLPDELEQISDSAFYGCTALSTIHLPDYPTVIRTAAFGRCNALKSVFIPAKVEAIWPGCFSNCESLERFEVDPLHEKYYTIDGALFQKTENGHLLKEYPCGKLDETYDVPEGTMTIDEFAFSGSNNLVRINIPSSVNWIRGHAFSECKHLLDINVHSANQDYYDIDGVLIWSWYSTTLYVYPEGRQGHYIVPEEIEEIEDAAFYQCIGLTSIYLHDDVFLIGSDAFRGCSNLSSVHYPASCQSIGNGVFAECTALTEFEVSSSIKQICTHAFENCSNLKHILIPSSVEIISWEAFLGCTGIQSLQFGTKLSPTNLSIERDAFRNSKIEHIYMYPPYPPYIQGDSFTDEEYTNTMVHIPAGYLQYYKTPGASRGWYKFQNIGEDLDTDVNAIISNHIGIRVSPSLLTIQSENLNIPISVTDMAGRLVYKGKAPHIPLIPGVYIVSIGEFRKKIICP